MPDELIDYYFPPKTTDPLSHRCIKVTERILRPYRKGVPRPRRKAVNKALRAIDVIVYLAFTHDARGVLPFWAVHCRSLLDELAVIAEDYDRLLASARTEGAKLHVRQLKDELTGEMDEITRLHENLDSTHFHFQEHFRILMFLMSFEPTDAVDLAGLIELHGLHTQYFSEPSTAILLEYLRAAKAVQLKPFYASIEKSKSLQLKSSLVELQSCELELVVASLLRP